MSKYARYRLENAGIYVGYFIVFCFFAFPIFWVISLSLKSVPELFLTPPIWFSKTPQFQNYLFVIKNMEILHYMWNSAKIVVVTIGLTLLLSFPAAYALSRFQFKMKRPVMLMILVFQMISPVIIAIPLYRLFSEIGLINQSAGLIAVYVAVEIPLSTWFLKGYLDTLPMELDEAAIVDGCSRWSTLWRVLLPVAMPGVASVMILIAVASWSQFIIPFILLDDKDMFPMSLGLVTLKNSSDAITTHYLAAASSIGILPVMIAFILLQRFIVGALTNGAVKG
ncbi:carbohydrate ABC transporter permease [Paenibacillus frigoriresistens]|uniref:carbohydrate ABC transporter permease n=1 Tax=Paenibacillus alginolyticus TaxID=59839 RepID=UPI001563A150|nr:carbohydrate ABC transporter permease [Paenibacillus frigoriresistens]NRF93743.1 carbohydrate ABC transporter permease [Paenibacillus frigoriresistens]